MSDNLNKAESQSPMIDCSHPWKEIQTVHEFGEIYEQCRLCDHIITSRIINNEKIEARIDELVKLRIDLAPKEGVESYDILMIDDRIATLKKGSE